jgi:Zn-finger nucleic acid-binding protein
MLHLCPKCKTATLNALSTARTPPRSEASPVPPSRCTSCAGVWMPKGALSPELEPADGAPAASAPADKAPAGADAKVGFCPAGHGLLIRARVETPKAAFHLDRCGTCAGIWFDAGEWAALAATEWLHHVDDLWDPIYKKRMREERSRKQHVDALAQALGATLAQQVAQLAGELKKHPHRSLAVAYLLDELKEG